MDKQKPGVFSYVAVFIVIILCLIHSETAFCFVADEVLVVVNTRMSGGRDIAKKYMHVRDIPPENIVTTSLTLHEVMEREEYEKRLLKPIQEKIAALKKQGQNIYAIVLVYGVPLKVLPPAPDWSTEDTIAELRRKRSTLQKDNTKQTEVEKLIKELATQIDELAGTNKRAAVDSELMLAKAKTYELSGWLENPYFIGFQDKKTVVSKSEVLLVARLDGPDEKTVYRMIEDTIATEKKGLQGTAYFDARWPLPEKKQLSGYAQWDASLHKAARIVENRMPVKLDAQPELFAPGSAPDAALYAGWYSLGKYVDSFSWVRGAVGYHIASAECSTLKKADSQVWCVQMLSKGVAATIGPVYEPYVQGFPLPELFFAALTEGYMDLGESYLIALPYISWQMVLVGDPLYRPFDPLPAVKTQPAHQ